MMFLYVLFPAKADHKWQENKEGRTEMCCVKLHRILPFIVKEDTCFDEE